MKKVCVVTATRAEYGLLRWVIDEIYHSKELELQLIVTGSHLSPEHGLTYHQIEDDGYPISKKIEYLISSETQHGIVKGMGVCSLSFADAFHELQPDVLIVLGDRYELLPIVSAALVMNIPVAHIAGGDVTEGAIDNQVRNAVTMMSTVHFPGTEESAQRIKRMIGHSQNVYVTGETNLDNFIRLPQLSRDELATSLSIDYTKKWVLCTYHAETRLSLDENLLRVTNLIELFNDDLADYEIVITKANADFGGDAINALFSEASKSSSHIHIFSSLGQLRYISMLQQVEFMIGNSSSGIFETPLIKLPVINIGSRQMGRLYTSNIIVSDGSYESLHDCISGLASLKFMDALKNVDNPYGDGHASEKIVSTINKLFNA